MGIALIIPEVNFENNLGAIAIGGDYKVTYNLRNCVVSSKPTTVNDGDELLLTISALNEYCMISSVVITMGGVDVTSTVYANGTVHISSCNGDIVITALAAYTLPSGYTLIDKVKVPAGAYFNTGITPSANTSFNYNVTVDSNVYSDTSKAPHILSNTNYYAPLCWGSYNGLLNFWHCNRCGNEVGHSVTLPPDYTYEVDAYNDGNNIKINDTTFECSAGSSSPSGSLYFGCYGGNTSTAKYYFVGSVNNAIIIKSNGSAVSIMVPCKNSNSAVGFYDVVRGNFYTSSTSVSFTE